MENEHHMVIARFSNEQEAIAWANNMTAGRQAVQEGRQASYHMVGGDIGLDVPKEDMDKFMDFLKGEAGFSVQAVAKATKIPEEFLQVESTPAGRQPGDPINPIRGTSVNMDKLMKPEVVGKYMKVEEIAQAFFHAIGGVPSEDSLERLLEYVHEQAKLMWTKGELVEQIDGNHIKSVKYDDFAKELTEELKDIAGVSGVQVIFDDYPDTMSFVVKLDHSRLSEEEATDSITVMNEVIRRMKPEDLDKLEIIYHTKEVY